MHLMACSYVSTSFHVVAANGNTSVVRAVLLHGAHTGRADKHRVTPKMVARVGGREGTAEVARIGRRISIGI